VATNQMRREAAKRKLERQQERRAQQAKRRRKVAVITSAAVVVLVLVGVVLLSTIGGGASDPTDVAAPPTAPVPTPATCEFTPSGRPPAKPVAVPEIPEAPTEGQVAVTLQTDRGEIPLTLDRAQAPCTVASFVHLAQADFYDATPCHRLTAGGSLSVLQCGDPTGTGSGGPGYTILDETSPDLTYPRGTVAMAKTPDPDSGGSQFFLVYADSALPPEYTVFGTIGEPGLAVLDQIAAGGLTDERQPGDGAPAQPVTITDVVVAS
jgi:peptidyl-prolyl cis-trans isomerase B (cyclophilin B)